MDIFDIFFLIAGMLLLILGTSKKFFSYAAKKTGQTDAIKNNKALIICGAFLLLLVLAKVTKYS